VDVPFGRPVTLITRTVLGHDVDGNTTWSQSSTTYASRPAWQGNSTELIQGQDTVISQATVVLPAGTPVQATDRVIVFGQTWEVLGSPNLFRNPWTGTDPGVVVQLRVVE
jgi:hypothetical protein